MAPTDFYLEFSGEVLRGDRYPAAGAANSGFGATALSAQTGGDFGFSNSWLFGLSWLGAEALDRGYGIAGAGRVEAAVCTQPGAEQVTIGLDELYQEPAHFVINRFQSLCSASFSSGPDRLAIPGRAIATMSNPPSSAWVWRNVSLM